MSAHKSLSGSPPRAWGLDLSPADSSLPNGSPPRAWGLVSLGGVFDISQRFTPTGVGTGDSNAFTMASMSVHPHGRGDWASSATAPMDDGGSPPRAWGLAPSTSRSWSLPRFTPTGVGTGAYSLARSADNSVHPHGRGDWDAAWELSTPVHGSPHGRGDWIEGLYRNWKGHGSPPRAWGLVSRLPPDVTLSRFTPTGVGTGRSEEFTWDLVAVHPHGRGDWADIVSHHHGITGSPPRAWGLGPVRNLVTRP